MARNGWPSASALAAVPATRSKAPSPSAGRSWPPTAPGCGATTAPRPSPRPSTPTTTPSGATSNSVGSRVQGVDLLGVLGQHAAALELHRWRELLRVREPLVGEDGEPLHLLDLREASVGF